MDFCSSHFGKVLSELTFEDVSVFFQTEKTETDQLEFKSFAGNLNDSYAGIVKTICAFLNSKGGLLIWGAPRGINIQGRNEKIFQGELTPITPLMIKDSLISKCSDSIIPLPAGIRIQIVENVNRACICIFEVDESNYSPHQFDKTYLMRIDGQTKPAPHHYVEALFRKIRYPELEGYLKLTESTIRNNTWAISFDMYFFNWSPLQNVEELSFRVLCDNASFHPFKVQANPDHYSLEDHEYRRENFRSVLHYGQPVRDANTVLVDLSVMDKRNLAKGTLFFMLAFGGKNCPSKSSEYDLNLWNQGQAENMVVARRENQLFKDLQDRKGLTKQETLKKLLGR